MSSGEPRRIGRFEVFTGAGRRRARSLEEKAAVVAESLADGETVCGVARRCGLTPQQRFTRRLQARVAADDDEAPVGPAFVPAVVMVDEPAAPERSEPVRQRGRPKRRKGPGMIEVKIGGATVRGRSRCRGEGGDGDPSGPEGPAAIGPTGSVRVMVAVKPVNFRKGVDGLAALMRDEIRADPFDGAIYVFRVKRADRVKLIWWAGMGAPFRETVR